MARQVNVSADDDRYFGLEGLARYSGISARTLRRYMNDPVNPLPHHHVRVGGKERGRVLIRKSAFDAWVEQFAGLAPKADTPDAAMDARVASALGTTARVRRLARSAR